MDRFDKLPKQFKTCTHEQLNLITARILKYASDWAIERAEVQR
jgi:hypothetical protein